MRVQTPLEGTGGVLRALIVMEVGTSMRALAWDEPLAWVTWKVVAVPAGASFHETVKVTPFWLAAAEWA